MKSRVSKKNALLLYNMVVPQLKGAEDSESSSDEFAEEKGRYSDVETTLENDETNLFTSMRHKIRASARVQQIWAWQALVKSFKESMQPMGA
jgi:hypothetical protein